ncbi:MAG: phage baseplate assembly protein V, partial [bacterium]
MFDAVGVIRAIVSEQLRGFHSAELGVVTAVYAHAGGSDADWYQCDVRLRDSGLELKRVSVTTYRIGAGALPDVGNLVLLQFVGGAIDAAVIVGCLYNEDDAPPTLKVHENVYV